MRASSSAPYDTIDPAVLSQVVRLDQNSPDFLLTDCWSGSCCDNLVAVKETVTIVSSRVVPVWDAFGFLVHLPGLKIII
jgi:hypothetical protein